MKKELKKFPKKLKFNKNMRGTLKIINFKKKNFDKYIVIKSISAGLLNWKILNETIKNIKKIFKRKKNKIRFAINIMLNWPISKKPKGIRMGKGKGKINFDGWFARVPANTIIFKFEGLERDELEKKKKILINILPIPCILV